jgi:lactoylglutathione lyase
MSSWEYEPGKHVIAQDEPEQPAETVGFRLNHLMLRIKVPLCHHRLTIQDPAVSVPFYRDVIGLARIFTFNSGPMTVYYMGYPKFGWSSLETFQKMQKRDGMLELVHVHGTENDKDFKYVHGNEAPTWGLFVSGTSEANVVVISALLSQTSLRR